MSISELTLLELRRIQAATAQAIGVAREALQVGPFLAAFHPTSDIVWQNCATPTADNASREQVIDAVTELRQQFRQRQRRLKFEYFEPLWPDLAAWLDEAGLVLEHRMPLMICTAADLRPVEAPGVDIHWVTADADDALLLEFLQTVRRGFGDINLGELRPDEITELRESLVRGFYRCALGRIEGVAAGVATFSVGNEELVGVATVSEYRRRGVAAMLSSFLIKHHFMHGGALAWLSAGSQIARQVYEKVGFKLVGDQLNYIDP
jgi:ribosomal protein S18 acetylase RimI-like enzyme